MPETTEDNERTFDLNLADVSRILSGIKSTFAHCNIDIPYYI